MWDRRMEQLQNELQGKLMQMGALKRAIVSVPEDITAHTHCCENLKSNQISSKVSLIFNKRPYICSNITNSFLQDKVFYSNRYPSAHYTGTCLNRT
jgi:hypothetical protein